MPMCSSGSSCLLKSCKKRVLRSLARDGPEPEGEGISYRWLRSGNEKSFIHMPLQCRFPSEFAVFFGNMGEQPADREAVYLRHEIRCRSFEEEAPLQLG